jgi:hypothetical protein
MCMNGMKERTNKQMNEWKKEQTKECKWINECMKFGCLYYCNTHIDPCWTCTKYKSLLPTKPLYLEA